MTSGCRTYHDPLHGAITLDWDRPAERLAMTLIDTAPFQRLRRIRQLGPAFLTFHGAESSRFTHSLGVLHLARRALGQLSRLDPGLERQQELLYVAALLHDIGHGPFSHTGEEMFGVRHEHWSARIIREHPAIRDCLNRRNAGLAEQVAQLLEGHRAHHPVAAALVSSQLDCDRLDYLLRDSHSTGAHYGQLDLDRLLSALTLAPDGTIAIHAKGLVAAEHYLLVRSLMYRSVYNHRLNVVCNWLLRRVVASARALGPERVECDSVMSRWLWPDPPLDVVTYLGQDDLRLGYHLLRWRESGPAPLQELCGRLLERRLLKAMDVSTLPSDHQVQLLQAAKHLSGREDLQHDLCCDLHRHRSRGYDPYSGGLKVWDGERLRSLEHHSPLVATLIKPTALAWLLHPGEISRELLSIRRDLLGSQSRSRPVLMEPPPFPLDQPATVGWSEPLPPQLLEFPEAGSRSWQEHVHHLLESLPQQTALVVRAGDHQLGTSDLRDLKRWLQAEDHRLLAIATRCATTLVAARASGVPAWREPPADGGDNRLLHVDQPQAKDPGSTIEMHIGTLRSGHHLAVDDSSILLLGDVNPGATISAGGHILVWGRLRGVAHAGNPGGTTARIAALHLRPVQLRIAALVARGPEESPPLGQAEQALIRDGKIRIEPAEAGWTKGLSLKQLPAIPWFPRLASS